MDITQALPLLGGLSPERFMKQYWQKKPLLIRGAVPDVRAIDRSTLFELAAREDVESRLIERFERLPAPAKTSRSSSASRERKAAGWRMRHGPFERRAIPPLKRAAWTLLVQGVNLHLPDVHELMTAFRFVPDARLDDVMISYASDGGGVGPHFDSYDVFLLQAQGQRRWQIGAQKDLSLQEGVPLKILSRFEPGQTWVLEPGDMLYLPPRYAHDGVAVGGDCMTYSVGFRAPAQAELGQALLERLSEDLSLPARLYQDKQQAALAEPARIPEALQHFAQDALTAALAAMNQPEALARSLGEYLTEPKAQVWFESPEDTPDLKGGVRLDRRSRMLFDERHVFINGESYRASGRDAQLMRRLANQRCLDADDCRRASPAAMALLHDWYESGWIEPLE